MIKINFNGLKTPYRKTVRSAVEFFMQELLSKRKSDNTELTVRFIKLPSNIHGFCHIDDDEDNLYSPKTFNIDISSKLGLERLLETLAHEMVHMRQFRNKELCYRENYTRFRGVAYSLDMPYEKEPWEKEAYKLEKSLVKKFMKECM